MEIELEDEKLTKDEYLGLITLDLKLVPKFTSEEADIKDVRKFILLNLTEKKFFIFLRHFLFQNYLVRLVRQF